MNMIDKLEKILVSPRLRANSKSFVESMLEQAKKRDLSEKQISYVDKFWAECFPPQEVLDEENSWASSYTNEMRENINIIAQYYEYHYPNSKIAKSYKDANWIPDKQLYEKSVNSQYAKITIENYKKKFRFDIGETIVMRDTQYNRSRYPNMTKDNYLVLEQLKEAKNNFALEYKVVSLEKMEEQKILQLKEANLNIVKNKKAKNG